MVRKTFIFEAKGKAFNLETFATEEKTFLTQRNDIEFKSKTEFIECINHAIKTFYENMIERLEEGVPELSVSYRGHAVNLMFFNVKEGNSFSISTNKAKVRDLIFELVQQTEATLSQVKARADAYEDLPVSLQR